MLGFLHKDFFAQRALFDIATPTSPVPSGPDQFVSLVAAVTGAETGMDRQHVWGPWDVAQQHGIADRACDCPFRRMCPYLVLQLAGTQGADNKSSQRRYVLQKLIFVDDGASQSWLTESERLFSNIAVCSSSASW